MKTPFHLDGKRILVTGASSGIGRQVAISVTEMGGTVLITGRDKVRLEHTYAALRGDGHQQLLADLLHGPDRTALIDALPGLDGIVHSAGIVQVFPIKFVHQALLSETMDINYKAPALLTAEITKKKKLNKRASIVFISSIASQAPWKGGSSYGASKAALEAFSRVLALEFQQQGIRANCISPAMVKTAMYDTAESVASKEKMTEYMERYPLGVGHPDDVANAAIFLLSEASRWITGINMVLDGGFLINDQQ